MHGEFLYLQSTTALASFQLSVASLGMATCWCSNSFPGKCDGSSSVAWPVCLPFQWHAYIFLIFLHVMQSPSWFSVFSWYFIFKDLFYECKCLVCMYVYTICIPSASGSKKSVLDTLKLDLQMAVNRHVGAENRTWVLCRSNKCS